MPLRRAPTLRHTPFASAAVCRTHAVCHSLATSPLLRRNRTAIKRRGFGCWLSGVDVNTQQSFEQLNARSVAVVVDPIQSVKGKVVVDAFRCINPQSIMMGQEPRQTTSVLGHLQKPSVQALIHGLNRHYYSLPISYRKNELEAKMLMNLNRKKWSSGLSSDATPSEQAAANASLAASLRDMTATYAKRVAEEEASGATASQAVVAGVGRVDPKKRIEQDAAAALGTNAVAVATTCFEKLIVSG